MKRGWSKPYHKCMLALSLFLSGVTAVKTNHSHLNWLVLHVTRIKNNRLKFALPLWGLLFDNNSWLETVESLLSDMNHQCFLCSTGELRLRAALITFTTCYSYMQKAIFLRDPLYLWVTAASRLGSWSVYVFNIFWVALLGNKLGVAWPWVYRNNGQQLTGT